MALLDDILAAFKSPSQAAHSLPGILKQMYYQERSAHFPVISPGRSRGAGATAPAPTIAGNFIGLAFTVDIDEAFRVFRVPRAAIRDVALHVHWTKNTDLDVSGHTVKWVVDYSVVNGASDDASIATESVEAEDTYDDAGTTTRVVHRTVNMPLPVGSAGKYVHLRVRAVSPSAGTPLVEPLLSSVDMTFIERINEDPAD